MLELVTERKALKFMLDGKECSLPLELGLDETLSMGEAYARAKADGEGDDGQFRGGVDIVRWFVAFAERYAPGAKGLSFDSACSLMEAWKQARSELAGATEGE